MWPLLLLIAAGAIGCDFFRSPPPMPRPVDRPPPPLPRDNFLRHSGESCEDFTGRLRPMGFPSLTADLAQYRAVVGKVTANRSRPNELTRDAAFQSLVAALPHASVLFNDGTPFAIDTSLDVDNFFVVYGFLEYLSGITPPPASARAVPTVWGLRMFNAPRSSNSVHLAFSSQDLKGLDTVLSECRFPITTYLRSEITARN